MRLRITMAVAMFTTLALILGAVFGVSSAAAAGDPTVYDPWKSGDAPSECAQIGDYDGGYKVDAAAPNGTYTVDSYGNKVTISNSDGYIFDWSSNFPIGAVIVKAATVANVWFYNPQSSGDTGLYAYEKKGISHVTFCWQYQLDVSKTADTAFTRDFDWTIEKSVDQTKLTLSQGQQHVVKYTVKATKDGGTDSDWTVSGDITIKNNTPIPFTVSEVEDIVSDGISADVSCALPTVLAPGDSLVCTYSTSLPNGDQRLNTATVTYYKTAGKDRTATATKDVIFGDPTLVKDDCVEITDSYNGSLDTTCATREYTYERTINANDLQCGPNTVGNTAYLKSDDGVTEEASATVTVDVVCANGCTLTQGYWKTHSREGPAPYDDAWKNLGVLEEDTLFFNSGKTWYTVFRTPPAGNAFYNLAHQYMAARLNVLNGASTTPAVDKALTDAEALFTGLSKESTTLTAAQRKTALALAGTLDSYNNGLIGPGHCSE